MTTRDISDRTGCKPRMATVILCRMRCSSLVEKIENWGWKITRDGINCLLITNSNNNNIYANTIQTQCKHEANTMLTQCKHEFPLEKQQQTKQEDIPGCFHHNFCHIKQLCQSKEYNRKTSELCPGCVWFKSVLWTGRQSST